MCAIGAFAVSVSVLPQARDTGGRLSPPHSRGCALTCSFGEEHRQALASLVDEAWGIDGLVRVRSNPIADFETHQPGESLLFASEPTFPTISQPWLPRKLLM